MKDFLGEKQFSQPASELLLDVTVQLGRSFLLTQCCHSVPLRGAFRVSQCRSSLFSQLCDCITSNTAMGLCKRLQSLPGRGCSMEGLGERGQPHSLYKHNFAPMFLVFLVFQRPMENFFLPLSLSSMAKKYIYQQAGKQKHAIQTL